MLSNKLRNKKIQLFLPFLALTGKALSTSDKPVIIPNITTNIAEFLSGDNQFLNEIMRLYPLGNNVYRNIAKKFIEKVIDIETEENIDSLLDEHFKTSKVEIKSKIKNEILKALPEYLHLLIEKKIIYLQNKDKIYEISSIFNKICEDLNKNSESRNKILNKILENPLKKEILDLKEKIEYDLKTCNLVIKATPKRLLFTRLFSHRNKAKLIEELKAINVCSSKLLLNT